MWFATSALFITPCVTLSGFVFSILVLAHLVSVKTSPQSAMFPRDYNWFLAPQWKAVLTQKKIEMRRTCVWHSYFPPTSLAVVLFHTAARRTERAERAEISLAFHVGAQHSLLLSVFFFLLFSQPLGYFPLESHGVSLWGRGPDNIINVPQALIKSL